MTRLNISRPPTVTCVGLASSHSPLRSPKPACSSPASASRRQSLGNAGPWARSAASFARRSAISLFSSPPPSPPLPLPPAAAASASCFMASYARLERGFHELIEIAIEHRAGVAHLHSGTQVLDARLVEDIRADLVAPAHIRLGILEHPGGGIALVDLQLVELRLEHLHGGGAVLVLAALVLAGGHDAAGQMGDAHRRLGLVDVLSTRSGGAVDVHLQVRGIDLDLDVVIDLGRDEHGCERGVAAVSGIEWRLGHQPTHAGLGRQATAS